MSSRELTPVVFSTGLAALADSDLPCELVGVDRSPAFVEIAAQQLGTRATLQEADATALPFSDQSFHLVTNTLMLHHLPHGVRHALGAPRRHLRGDV